MLGAGRTIPGCNPRRVAGQDVDPGHTPAALNPKGWLDRTRIPACLLFARREIGRGTRRAHEPTRKGAGVREGMSRRAWHALTHDPGGRAAEDGAAAW
jgi:hypothetical protein